MIRARTAAACFDDEDGDGTAVPTWIMGIPYTELREEERRLDVFSTMWITYRSGFPKMEPYGYTDDSGWGCMLRSAQMLMTQALQRHTLGRPWRVPRTLEERLRVPEYRTLIRLFADHPGEDCLFSIHNMCQVGIRYDKLPGEWYGPTTAACVLRDISELYATRLSPQPQRRASSADSRRQPSPRPQPPPPPPPPRPPTATPSPQATADVTLGDTDAPPQEEEEEDSRGEPAREERARLRSGAAPPRGREEVGHGDEGGVGPANGDGRGSDGVVFPSSRPLRVFVSQGDVVYIDEVEAVALRGGAPGGETVPSVGLSENGETAVVDVGTAHAPVPVAAAEVGRSTPDEREAPLVGKTGPSTDAEGCSGPGRGAVSSPAFFDPLLNPGNGDGGGGGKDGKEEEAWSSAVLLLVPLRLGLNELSAGYIPSLLQMLRVPQSLGFLGGRPNHAIFFIGAQGQFLTGLDPHTTQAAPDMSGAFPTERYVHSLHCQSAVSMDIHRIDPSLALAFYLPDRASFQDLAKRIAETTPPPFSVEQTRPDYEGEMGLAFMINQRDDDGTTDDDDDEYVFVKGPER